MDGINSISGAQAVQPPMNQQTRQNQQMQEQNGQAPPPPFITEISQLGQLFKAVEETGESAQSELKQFHESLFEALQSGNFDAESLAESASDTIKEIAEAAGIDLTQALTEFETNAPQGPPPPPAEDGLFTSTDEDEDTTSIL